MPPGIEKVAALIKRLAIAWICCRSWYMLDQHGSWSTVERFFARSVLIVPRLRDVDGGNCRATSCVVNALVDARRFQSGAYYGAVRFARGHAAHDVADRDALGAFALGFA